MGPKTSIGAHSIDSMADRVVTETVVPIIDYGGVADSESNPIFSRAKYSEAGFIEVPADLFVEVAHFVTIVAWIRIKLLETMVFPSIASSGWPTHFSLCSLRSIFMSEMVSIKCCFISCMVECSYSSWS